MKIVGYVQIALCQCEAVVLVFAKDRRPMDLHEGRTRPHACRHVRAPIDMVDELIDSLQRFKKP